MPETLQQFWETNAQPWTQAVQGRLVESRRVTGPAIVREIIAERPRAVLDLGCGEGWIGSELIAQGIGYTGIDFSTALVENARATHPGLRFEAVSYESMIEGRWKPERDFDSAVFNFSLFEEKLHPILKKTGEHVSPYGSIIVQTLHPCFALLPYESGSRTEDFKSFPVAFRGGMPWYGHTLASWISEIGKAGLKIRRLVEPAHPETRVPLSLIFVLDRDT